MISARDILAQYPLDATGCNVTTHIAGKVGMNLHQRPLHPLGIMLKQIMEFWTPQSFRLYDALPPIVSTERNFDVLRIPIDHVSRSPSDTYYLNSETVLRTHTSAHQVELLASGEDRFLVAGDVYRRDEIDKSHYPVFHQMEGVKVFKAEHGPADIAFIQSALKNDLEKLAIHLFGSDIKMRWVDTYFPFTEPSFELEIFFDNDWLEVLGCGVVHPDIFSAAGRSGETGYAFGLGLERLAMVLFQIPDIRLFWTEDKRFHDQFTSGKIVPFQSYSKFPPCLKDISFWLDGIHGTSKFHVNDLNELVRDIAGDLVEQVALIDSFTHPKSGRTSHCYRISYRSMDRSLTNQEIDDFQEKVRQEVVAQLGVELR